MLKPIWGEKLLASPSWVIVGNGTIWKSLLRNRIFVRDSREKQSDNPIHHISDTRNKTPQQGSYCITYSLVRIQKWWGAVFQTKSTSVTRSCASQDRTALIWVLWFPPWGAESHPLQVSLDRTGGLDAMCPPELLYCSPPQLHRGQKIQQRAPGWDKGRQRSLTVGKTGLAWLIANQTRGR